MNYLLLRDIHITCAALSGLGFLLRGWWMARDSAWLHHRVTRTLPHLNDTLLLGSAVWMASRLGQYPLVTPWLTAKLAALLGYIVLGGIALKRGRTRRLRLTALAAALLCYGYIVAAAVTRTPFPFA
ncbi:SirB2 family protein [Endothiovibrio diazotrophicus]